MAGSALIGVRGALSLLAALVVLAVLGADRARATEPLEQSGDVFVGALRSSGSNGGAVFRIRGGTAEVYCSSTSNSFDADYWDVPSSLVVDGQGRIVFLAKLGAYWPGQSDYGLLRCSGPGSPVEKLAIFPSTPLGSTDLKGWPLPFPDKLIESGYAATSIGSLHILHVGSVTESGGLPQVGSEDAYEFVVRDAGVMPELIRYGVDSGRWQDGTDLVPLPTGPSFPSVIVHDGDYWMLQSADARFRDQSTIERLSAPLQLDASGTIGGVGFHVSIGLFGGQQVLAGPKLKVNGDYYQDTNCQIPKDWDPSFVPAPLSDTAQVLYDEWGSDGLTITDTYGPTPAFLSRVSSELLDDDPLNDSHAFTTQGNASPYCDGAPTLKADRFANFRADDGTLNSAQPVAWTADGLVGSQLATGEVVRLSKGDKAKALVGGLVRPGGIAGYPAKVPSAGTVLTVSVHSPVNVLLTDPAGHRLGVDPGTGQPVDEFGLHGFDSGGQEPRIFAIKNASPGTFTIDAADTGDGPYEIEIATANLDTGQSDRIVTSGTASAGRSHSVGFTLSPDGALAFVGGPLDSTPPVSTATVSPAPGGDGWNSGDVTVQLSASDETDGSGVASIHYSTGGAETTVPGSSATVDVVNEGETALTYFAVDNAGNAETPHTLTVRIDSTAPEVTCATPDGAWHGADVTIHCTAADALSGLADAADSSFDLATAVPPGTETADAVTGSRSVCDTVGNCTAAGPVAGNEVDRKAPAITISAPAADAYLLGEAVAADYGCSDGGSGVAVCGGPVADGAVFDTGTVGAKSFAVSAADAVGNTTSTAVPYTVDFAIRLLYDASQMKKAGSTIPVKLALCDALGVDVSSPAVDVRAVSVDGGPVNDAGNADPGGLFRHDGDGYVFNLSTKGLLPGRHVLSIAATGDPVLHTIEFTLR